MNESQTQAINQDQEALNRLLDHSEVRMFNDGPGRLTMDEIAHDLGVSKKTLYKHVDGKEHLFELVIERFAKGLRSRMDAMLERDDLDFDAKLNALAEIIADRFSQVQRHVISDLERYFPKVFQQMDRIRRKNIPEVFGKLIEQGKQCGAIRNDADPTLFCEVLLAAIQGMIRSDSMARLGYHPKDLIPKVVKLLVDGIRR